MGPGKFLDVRMDITNMCNLSCRMCFHSLESSRSQAPCYMSLELFEKIVTQVGPISNNLSLSCGAEPLVHPNFKEIVELAKNHAPKVGFITNGVLLDKELADFCVNKAVDYVHFSIDGATKETYEWFRRGAVFETFQQNVRDLVKAKEESGSKLPEISAGIVLMRRNITELSDIVRLVKDLGVNRLSAEYLRVFGGLGMEEESLENHAELTRTSISQARQVAREVNMEFNPPADLTVERCDAVKICRRPWTFINVWPMGAILPCESWHTNKPIGDFREKTFMEIWDGEEYQKLRKSLETQQDLHENCMQCHGFLSSQAGKDQFKTIIQGN